MKFSNPFQSKIDKLISKEEENSLYEKASSEFEANIINKGLWTKAFTKAKGIKEKQEYIYIELMVEYYKDQIMAGKELADILAIEEEKKKKEEDIKAMWQKKETQEDIDRKKKEEEEWLKTPEGKEEKRKEDFIFALFVIFPAVLMILILCFLIWTSF
tara:strand:- start:47 stop:520 length:474 start_codon:yes stop_codon:yes gene_type:complete